MRYCSTGCTMMILRNDYEGSSSGFFNRPWTDYQQGFGNCTTLYWIGLDRLHQLTQGNCHSRFDLLYRADGTWHYAQYSSFSVGDSSTNYTLTIDGWSGDTGYDPMEYHNGRQFSTYDADNDGWVGDNCASVFGGGFWFGDGCGPVGITTTGDFFEWPTSTSYMHLNVVEVSLLCQWIALEDGDRL